MTTFDGVCKKYIVYLFDKEKRIMLNMYRLLCGKGT